MEALYVQQALWVLKKREISGRQNLLPSNSSDRIKLVSLKVTQVYNMCFMPSTVITLKLCGYLIGKLKSLRMYVTRN